jgi:hemoglobin
VTAPSANPATTPYEQFGGSRFFASLTEDFYARIATDDLLRPMYAEEDLGPAQRRLQLFLEQYWGGPTTYSDHRGHPRLRMRHEPYEIDAEARDRWLAHIRAALTARQLAPDLDATMWDYLVSAAHFLQNVPD